MTIETKRIYEITRDKFHGFFSNREYDILCEFREEPYAVIEYDNKLIKVKLYQVKFIEEEQMTNTLDQLVEQVQQRSIDKDLHKGNSDRQALKFYEEAGEVAAALSRGQIDALKDGIGDTVVTLIILAQQHDMTLQECLQYAYDEIKGRKGKTINGTFIKEADLKE
ncbi:mazG nucleotide pyrophosphohydrolase domain protein [Staphylococcus devriesei]|nr:mazG nucleotide pyrophosphohydrolase domain protein [Staphylococcus devriesei]